MTDRVKTADCKQAVLEAKGATSKRNIKVCLERREPGHGIVFRLPSLDPSQPALLLPALATNVVNTLRNVTIGQGSLRLSLVEHLLCAVAVWGLDDLLIDVDGPEIPLADGGAQFWLELFERSGWERNVPQATRELKEPIICKSGDRLLMAIPDADFSLNYMMDWQHPQIGKIWQVWNRNSAPEEICKARTFGSMKEHQLLGLADDMVSLTEDGFSKELYFSDEPVRHKLLDLLGDLFLCGVNPLRIKARFISIKGGHELDVQMAKRLMEQISEVASENKPD